MEYQMFKVYRVTGANTNSTYIGYSEVEDVGADFKAGKMSRFHNENEQDRGDVRIITDNKGDFSSLSFEILSEHEDEMDALIARNEQRVLDPDSVTGPTCFPGRVFQQAQKHRPDALKRISTIFGAWSESTARKAYAKGLWSADVIKGLVSSPSTKKTVLSDLDKMSPRDFASKYAL
jgi:hypothetical protein